MKCLLVVGHSVGEQGAANKTTKITEFMYNTALATNIMQRAVWFNLDVDVIFKEENETELIREINNRNPDIVIVLHCNAFNQEISGSEVLHSGSDGSLMLAEMLLLQFISVLELNNRGVIERKTGRGSKILMGTKMPCVITEPFFIDNDSDLTFGLNHIKDIAFAYCEAIKEYSLNFDKKNT